MRLPGKRRSPLIVRTAVAARSSPRVLLLDDHPPGLAPDVDALLVEQLRHLSMPINLDVIRRPASALRVIDDNEAALDRYQAVIAITGGTSERREPRALELAARRIAIRVPTLVVHIERQTAAREPVQNSRAGGAGGPGLVLPAGVNTSTAARRIARTLHALLQIAEATPNPDRAILTGHRGVVHRRLDHITRITRDAFEFQTAEINLVDDEHVTTIASAENNLRRHPTHDSLCAIALTRPGITVMPDTWLDPDARRTTPTHGHNPIRFYAAVPIHNSAGDLIGTLCTYDTIPRNAADIDYPLFHDLALLAEGELIDATRLHTQPH